MNRFLLQSGLILISFLLIFFWQKSAFALYSVPALGMLTVLYIFLTLKRHTSKENVANIYESKNKILIIFLLNTSSLLLIFTTGGLNSYLFFLLYFLSFGIGFMLIPETVFVFNIGVLFLFLPEAMGNNIIPNLIKLGSVFLLCPLAYFFGKVIGVRETEIKETKQASERIIRDVSDIVKSEGKILKERDIKNLKDIVDESRKLEEGNL